MRCVYKHESDGIWMNLDGGLKGERPGLVIVITEPVHEALGVEVATTMMIKLGKDVKEIEKMIAALYEVVDVWR